MFEEGDSNLVENAEEYSRVYHSLIEEGKSDVYAHAYAYVFGAHEPPFCEKYANAFELATNHGRDSFEASCFGHFCAETSNYGLISDISILNENYKEQWQKEFYLKLLCDEIRKDEKREINASLLRDLRKKMGL